MDKLAQQKRILIIAGPNGAGKTTFALEFLKAAEDFPNFINADLIAAGLSPLQPGRAAIRAGRLMLQEIEACVRAGESFAFESTLSGKGYSQKIPLWKAKGYRVKLYYLKLASVEMAIARVAARVNQGGHNIPEDLIRRRFELGMRNFQSLYKGIVDEWVLIENSGTMPVMVEEGMSNERE